MPASDCTESCFNTAAHDRLNKSTDLCLAQGDIRSIRRTSSRRWEYEIQHKVPVACVDSNDLGAAVSDIRWGCCS